MKKDKAKYFGPYTSSTAVKDVIELVRKIYMVRSCNRNLPRDCGKDRPCLYYHMKQCTAPCQGNVSEEAYKQNIGQVLHFLNGNYKETIDQLTEKMMAASEEMRFEDAAGYRDLINSIRRSTENDRRLLPMGKRTGILLQLPWMKVKISGSRITILWWNGV